MASLLFAHRRTTYSKKSEKRCNKEYRIKDTKLLNLEQTCNIKKKYLQSCFVNLLSKLVHSNVRGSTDQHLSVVLFDQVVHNGGRCHSLTSSRRTLKE